jgi:glutathione S-transferase
MSMTLYYHPFASFCQKVLIALYEAGIDFEPRFIDLGDAKSREALQQVWPLAKFPVLRDETGPMTLPESSVIIEYLALHYPAAARLVPSDPGKGLRARLFDRVFDNYVALQLTKIVTDQFRAEGRSDVDGVEQARATIEIAYGWLDSQLPNDGWAVGEDFTLADCAAAPALFYANTAIPFGRNTNLAAYYDRLRARPSFDRVVEEARPFRNLYPLPWPPDYR